MATTTTTTTFYHLYTATEGRIANLNRVLQNLKRAGEVSFQPECFFMGYNVSEIIVIHPTTTTSTAAVPPSKHSHDTTTALPHPPNPRPPTSSHYSVNASNLYQTSQRQGLGNTHVPYAQRRGLSYEADHKFLMMRRQQPHECFICHERINPFLDYWDQNRLTTVLLLRDRPRRHVCHARCIRCHQCHGTLRGQRCVDCCCRTFD